MGRPRQSNSHAVMVDLGAPRMGRYRNIMLTIIAQPKKALEHTPAQHGCETQVRAHRPDARSHAEVEESSVDDQLGHSCTHMQVVAGQRQMAASQPVTCWVLTWLELMPLIIARKVKSWREDPAGADRFSSGHLQMHQVLDIFASEPESWPAGSQCSRGRGASRWGKSVCELTCSRGR